MKLVLTKWRKQRLLTDYIINKWRFYNYLFEMNKFRSNKHQIDYFKQDIPGKSLYL